MTAAAGDSDDGGASLGLANDGDPLGDGGRGYGGQQQPIECQRPETRQAAQPINIGAYCSTGNVIHEIGHHFGIGDPRLRELGW